jgi:hypothetical protein
MPSFRATVLQYLDVARGVMGRSSLELRQYAVTRITRTWASGTVGRGAYTEASQALTCNGSNPRVREASPDQIKQLLGSGHLFKEGSFIVGPLTPEWTTGGYAYSGFDAATGEAKQILYRVVGPGVDSYFRAVSRDFSKPLRIELVLEPAANAPA